MVFDPDTTRHLLEAAQAGNVERLLALAAVDGATPATLTACLASTLFTGVQGFDAMLRCLLSMGASPNAQLSGELMRTVSSVVGTHHLLL